MVFQLHLTLATFVASFFCVTEQVFRRHPMAVATGSVHLKWDIILLWRQIFLDTQDHFILSPGRMFNRQDSSCQRTFGIVPIFASCLHELPLKRIRRHRHQLAFGRVNLKVPALGIAIAVFGVELGVVQLSLNLFHRKAGDFAFFTGNELRWIFGLGGLQPARLTPPR